jgi:hypothetical protein
MAYFEDLTIYNYGQIDGSVNIGWLDDEHEFRKGEVNPIILRNLYAIKASMPSFMTMRGEHRCELCGDGDVRHYGNGEIRVIEPDGTTYACPSMITHYIADHGYMPPDCFLDAVMEYNWSGA